MYYLHAVIILFSTGLYNSAFSTYSFGKLGYRLSLCVCVCVSVCVCVCVYFLPVLCFEFDAISKYLATFEQSFTCCCFFVCLLLYEKGLLIYKNRVIKVAATDIRYFERSKLSRSLVQEKFQLDRQVLFKLGYLFCQQMQDTTLEFE